VLQVELDDGTMLVVKAHKQRRHFEREVHAYRHWVPALGGRAPTLIDVDDTLQVIYLSALPGRPVAEISLAASAETAIHRRAGELLRRFHDAEAVKRSNAYASAQHERLEAWVDRAKPHLLESHEVAIARRLVGVLDVLPDPPLVPTHRDWQPRNWLLADNNFAGISIIDFEMADWGMWLEDVKRLYWAEWRQRPELADAFFEGYRHSMTPDDLRYFQAISALQHLSTIVWADEHGDETFLAHGRAALAEAGEIWSHQN
jgi:Ser/Thr protein kinase RdoA (MazF antagonist)